jgi:hypothetical protein
MTGLEVLLTVVGAAATLLVIAGMILLTPPGEVDIEQDAPSSQGSELSRADGTESPARVRSQVAPP